LWNAWATKSWITVVSPVGDTAGSGTVTYTVAANTTGETRYGKVIADSQEHTVMQEAGSETTTTTVPDDQTTTTTVPGDTTTTTVPDEPPSDNMTGAAEFVGTPVTGEAPLLVKFINTCK